MSCYNCGSPLGHMEIPFRDMITCDTGERMSVGKALDVLHVKNICCRVLFITYIEEPKLLKK